MVDLWERLAEEKDQLVVGYPGANIDMFSLPHSVNLGFRQRSNLLSQSF